MGSQPQNYNIVSRNSSAERPKAIHAHSYGNVKSFDIRRITIACIRVVISVPVKYLASRYDET